METNKGGRPAKYNAEMQSKADKYLKEYKETGDLIPMVESLVPILNVSRATLYNWKDQKFLDTLDKISTEQKRQLINNGLGGRYNAQITKLMLGTHGISEKTENKHEGTVKIVASPLDEDI